MTRINSAIPVKCLTDEHLLAESREVKRLPHSLMQAIKSGSIEKVPKQFTLGKGHVTFFLDKMEFIYKRYLMIHDELVSRGFNVSDFSDNWQQMKDDLSLRQAVWNSYTPTTIEHQLLVERISSRIMQSTKKCWHYKRARITRDEAIEILQKLSSERYNIFSVVYE